MALFRATRHAFARMHIVVPDTNVLVHVFGEWYGELRPYETKRAAPYTGAFARALSAGAEVILLDVVLAEFFKVLESKASKQWHTVGAGRAFDLGDDFRNLKQFRAKGPHPRLLGTLLETVKKVLRHGRLDRVDLTQDSLPDLWSSIGSERIDFNDVLIARYCLQRRCLLLTADGDLTRFQDRVDIVHEARMA